MDCNVKLKRIDIKWEIKDFVNASANITNSHSLKSPPLALSNSKYFCIHLYPSGRDEASEDYVGLYVKSYKCMFEGRASFYILNSNDQAIGRLTMRTHLFKENDGYWGWRKFFKRSDLTSDPLLLPNRNLTIGCTMETEIELPWSLSTCPIEKALNDSLSEKKLSGYEELFENKTFSDVKFIVQGKEIHGHKNIIASQSTVLAAMFESKMKECNENIVNITDVPYNAMYELLRFLYAGKIKNFPNVAVDLLIASNKYLIEDLKTVCENHLSSRLTDQNVVEYLNLAELHDASLLKNRGINFITEHADTITESPSFNVSKLDESIWQEVFSSVAKSKKRKLDD